MLYCLHSVVLYVISHHNIPGWLITFNFKKRICRNCENNNTNMGDMWKTNICIKGQENRMSENYQCNNNNKCAYYLHVPNMITYKKNPNKRIKIQRAIE